MTRGHFGNVPSFLSFFCSLFFLYCYWRPSSGTFESSDVRSALFCKSKEETAHQEHSKHVAAWTRPSLRIQKRNRADQEKKRRGQNIGSGSHEVLLHLLVYINFVLWHSDSVKTNSKSEMSYHVFSSHSCFCPVTAGMDSSTHWPWLWISGS